MIDFLVGIEGTSGHVRMSGEFASGLEVADVSVAEVDLMLGLETDTIVDIRKNVLLTVLRKSRMMTE